MRHILASLVIVITLSSTAAHSAETVACYLQRVIDGFGTAAAYSVREAGFQLRFTGNVDLKITEVNRELGISYDISGFRGLHVPKQMGVINMRLTNNNTGATTEAEFDTVSGSGVGLLIATPSGLPGKPATEQVKLKCTYFDSSLR